MIKRLSKDQRRKALFNLKYEEICTKIQAEFQNKLREKQEELAKTGVLHSGYGQEKMRNIQISRMTKLAEEIVATDKEVYGDPTKEADKNRILNRVRLLVEANQMASHMGIKKEGRISPRVTAQQYEEAGADIILHIKSNLLISMKEKELSPRVRPSKFSSIKNWRMNHPLVALLVTIVAGIIVLAIGYYIFKFR